MNNADLQETVTKGQTVAAIGWLSGELAGRSRSGAWDGNAPDWFPEPPEWLELWERALVESAEVAGV